MGNSVRAFSYGAQAFQPACSSARLMAGWKARPTGVITLAPWKPNAYNSAKNFVCRVGFSMLIFVYHIRAEKSSVSSI